MSSNNLSSTSQAAAITEAAVAGVFFIAYGIYWAINRKAFHVKTPENEKIRRYGVYVSIMMIAAFLMTENIIFSVRNNLVFNLRNGAVFPIGYSSCNEYLTNIGVCANISRTSFYGIAFVLSSIGWAFFMQWRANTIVTHIFGTLLFVWGLQQFYLYDDGGWRWVSVAFFGLGAIIVILVHLVSSYYSWKHKGTTNVDVGSRPTTIPLFAQKQPMGTSNVVNALNYETTTGEFWLNLIAGPLMFLLFALFPALGPSGGNFWTYGTESWIYFAFDVVFFYILGAGKMIWFSFKSSEEIKQVSGGFGNKQ